MKVLGEWKNVCVQGEGTGLLRLEERTGDCWIVLYAQLSAGDAVQEKASAAVDALKEDPVTAAGAVLTVAASSAVKAIGVALGADSHVMRRTPGFENDFAKEFSQTFAETSELVMRKRLIFEKNLSNLTNCSRSGNTVSLEIGQNYHLTFEDQEYGESMSRGFLGSLEDARSQINDARIKQDIDWTLDANGLLTISGRGKMPDWEWHHDDGCYADTPWYERRDDIKAVHISAGFVNIGNCAFCECGNLTSVDIPDSVTVIGDRAFGGCKSLTNIHIPDSVTVIGDGAFSCCKSLTNIHIPNSVVSIGYSAFYNCDGLTTIVLPNCVTSIGKYTFHECKNLTSIHIPKSVTSIGEYAFHECKNLTNIHIPDSVTEIVESVFWDCKNLTSIHMPDSVTSIGFRAFKGCEELNNIHIPNSVTSIGACAFEGCNNLASIRIPNGVTEIEFSTFEECANLRNIVIPDRVTTIGDNAFSKCKSLTEIRIPNSVKKLGLGVFSKCKNLKRVYMPKRFDGPLFSLRFGISKEKVTFT